MDLSLNLNITQQQKLVMTQQMQLSIKLLQMSSYELEQYINQQIQENPLLDLKDNESRKEENSDDLQRYKEMIKYLGEDTQKPEYYQKDEEEVSPLNFITEDISLKTYLKQQLSMLNIQKDIKNICNYIIENIDKWGYIKEEDLQYIILNSKTEKDKVDLALETVQSFEPWGIGARSIKECLKIQLNKKEIYNEKIYEIIDNYLDDIAENRINNIAKSLNCTIKEIQEYSDIIKSLEPKPSRGFYTGENINYIIPDAFIKKIDNKYFIIMNEEVTPRLKINNLYKEIINNDSKDKQAVDYIKEKLNSAVFLIKSIEGRKNTVYKVLQEILKIQSDYFEIGDKYLKPMTLKQIADNINVHESTVSRAIKDKYVHTDKGTIKIKNFFTTGLALKNNENNISTNCIKKKIGDIINSEDKAKPISDSRITAILEDNGVKISRRTVAKYREELGIKSSSKRKRF